MQYYYRFILTILTLSISFADLASSQNKSNDSFFGVVYSSDRDIQQAKWETDQLAGRLSQYQNQAKLFKRRNWYVSVIVFPSRSDAKESLSIIENTYSRGSFVVNLQEWCRPDWNENKNKAVLKGVSYYDCRRGEIIPGRTGAIITNKFSTIKDAKSDLEKLKKNPFQKQQHNLTIFKRGDSYFTAVINYANKEEASQNLRGGYAVDINQFCPQPGELSKDDYIECK
ncbi:MULTISPECIES: hypothetical protein [unclassified Microcystis]|jgi:hypothetical protein|uniref:hypothetical protein n=1 Tax=unclassified Microcystis TaxID=2643300 RepID=UPI002584E3E9|nr:MULTISPECIES: hypothetical protein [unclassified Microcystis]MCA2761466.1 hypothetical protein [Microcystis sp. M151S2]MCA2641354.1 hypothetical protein [Microcystis sp. M087S2]MCA2671672.1 hypothetical protein [Microcystis sp. M080S2]MCA2690197.1 hypothetical protein [Microcystis sp. M037S2]MCA2732455.1 hypothetical protein [Microcystis sp. M158S2]